MAPTKSSLAPEGEPIAFELNKETGFRFIGKYEISVDDLLNGTISASKIEQAEKLLMDELSSGKAVEQKVAEAKGAKYPLTKKWFLLYNQRPVRKYHQHPNLPLLILLHRE